MDLNQDQPHTGGDSANLRPPPRSAGEIDLYDELLTFAEKSALSESVQSSDQTEAAPESLTSFGESGPLGTLSLEFTYTGAMSPGICIGCGAESGSEDLFCITCGAFVEEVGSKRPLNPTSAECGLDTSSDEVFCPGCGAAVTTS